MRSLRIFNFFSCLMVAALLAACGGGEDGTSAIPDPGPEPEPKPTGLALLGSLSHSITEVDLSVVATREDGLNMPRDLAFDPKTQALWIVNRVDPADPRQEGLRRGRMTVIGQLGTDKQVILNRATPIGGNHFFVEPAALAINDKGTFLATIHETDRMTQGAATPGDFMGPVLWPTDLTIFDAGHPGHMDMLHNTPLGMGIAWEDMNTYWVFDGYHSSITRYAFNADHGPGGADHSDGEISRFVEGQVRRVANVPSHLVLDRDRGLLYIADTGNSAIKALDIRSGERGGDLPSNKNYDRVKVFDYYVGADLRTVADGSQAGLSRPSGLALDGKLLYVTDNATSRIFAFKAADGELVDWLDTGLPPGSLMGITTRQGALYLVDHLEHRVLRIAPKQ
jgi:hypothetical protein